MLSQQDLKVLMESGEVDEKGKSKWVTQVENMAKEEKKKEKKGGMKNFDKLPLVKKNTGKGTYVFKETEYKGYILEKQSQGFIEVYYGDERCFSSMVNTPGVDLLPSGLWGVVNLIFLMYLFIGISISADIFMDAINVITATTKKVLIKDTETGQYYQVDVPVWNGTVATLTLMAFGSSAPEILLNVLGALSNLGAP